MRRFFLQTLLAPVMEVSGEDAHHISRVLRLTAGDTIVVVGYDGQVGRALISGITRDTVFLRLECLIEDCREPSLQVVLAQGLPKGDKMDYIIQKAVELGVSQVIPLATEHSVVRYDQVKVAVRVERWQKIAHAAAKQCGRNIVPQVTSVQGLGTVLGNMADGVIPVVLYEGQARQGLKAALAASQSQSYLLFIGPEGGFSQEEIASCQAAGAIVATMGPRILRTETAALAALAAIMYDKGDLGG